MDETMMNTVEEVVEDAVEVKPVLSKGAVIALATVATAAVVYGGYRLVKFIKKTRAQKAAAEAEAIELSEDNYSEVENG